MTDIIPLLRSLHRPRLLVRAARLGQAEYRRERDLARLVGAPKLPAPGEAVVDLLEKEARIEAARRDASASYSAAGHIDLLIALMAEARLLPRPGAPAAR